MPINIKLDSRHRVESDRHQFILVRDDRNIGFYPYLEDLVREYFLMKVRDCDAKSISHLLEVHKQLIRRLEHLLEPFKIKVVGINTTKSEEKGK